MIWKIWADTWLQRIEPTQPLGVEQQTPRKATGNSTQKYFLNHKSKLTRQTDQTKRKVYQKRLRLTVIISKEVRGKERLRQVCWPYVQCSFSKKQVLNLMWQSKIICSTWVVGMSLWYIVLFSSICLKHFSLMLKTLAKPNVFLLSCFSNWGKVSYC